MGTVLGMPASLTTTRFPWATVIGWSGCSRAA